MKKIIYIFQYIFNICNFNIYIYIYIYIYIHTYIYIEITYVGHRS